MTIRYVIQQEELQEKYSLTLTKPLEKQTNFDRGKVTLSFKWGKRETEVIEVEDTNVSSRIRVLSEEKYLFSFCLHLHVSH